jgi:hypothetical protein
MRGDIETVRHRQIALIRTFLEGVAVGIIVTFVAVIALGVVR